MPTFSFHQKFYAPKDVIYISWPPQWPSNIDNLYRPRELKSSLKHWARPLSSLGSSNEPADMAEAIRVEDDLKAAVTAQETLHLKVEAIRAKKEELADLDRQIAELQNQRSAVAS